MTAHNQQRVPPRRVASALPREMRYGRILEERGIRERSKMPGNENKLKLRWTRTYLHVTFCYIQRSNAGVGEAAREGTTKHALGIVAGVVGNGAEVAVCGDW